MLKRITTQINRDGSVSVWNSCKDDADSMQYYINHEPIGISQDRLNRLNDLRDFNRMPERMKLTAKDSSVLKHVPGEKGNCLSMAG